VRKSGAAPADTLVLNAGQELALEAPVPVAGGVTSELRIEALWDKGKATGVPMLSSRRVWDAADGLLATIRQCWCWTRGLRRRIEDLGERYALE
jgi:hypothetical protein